MVANIGGVGTAWWMGGRHKGKLGRGAHKNRDDDPGSVKLLKALLFPGR